ncbi:putative intracellular protease/amidase [Maribacter polysiphoniae]|nr:putative intracellular protease/amidase [Maribacter polysiphoniae]
MFKTFAPSHYASLGVENCFDLLGNGNNPKTNYKMNLKMSNTIKFKSLLFLCLFTVLLMGCNSKKSADSSTVKTVKTETKALKKILFVVTSHSEKGGTGEKTGYYLGEVSHPWDVLHTAGYEIDFVSPKGGKAPVDAFDMNDSINKKFWDNDIYRHKIENTKKPNEVNPDDYVAIHYAGGHGAMWDFADNTEIAAIAREIYENNGVVSAVCHGPAGLVNIKLSDGSYLVDGKKVNAFTNEEEIKVNLEDVVPFLLEDQLTARGAIFEKSAPFTKHVVTDQRLVTGQNPQSASSVGKAALKELQRRSKNAK